VIKNGFNQKKVHVLVDADLLDLRHQDLQEPHDGL
jgi:hypothetical protein